MKRSRFDQKKKMKRSRKQKKTSKSCRNNNFKCGICSSNVAFTVRSSKISLMRLISFITHFDSFGIGRDGLDGYCKAFGRDAKELAIAIFYAQE